MVPGSEVVLTGRPMISLVRAVDALARSGIARYAVIGGVAVSARLGQAHRATADVDAVVDETAPPPAVEALLALPHTEPDPNDAHRVRFEGTKVEVIDVEPVEEAAFEDLTDAQVLFVGSHSWALTTASELTVVAGAEPAVTATAPFATPAALVTMKLCALLNRRLPGGHDKRGGDAWDIFRLLSDLDGTGAVAEALSLAPQPLLTVVRSAIRSALVTHGARTRGWLAAGDEQMAGVSIGELRYVGQRLLDRLDGGS